ncbi:MAG: hypothetical protein ACOC70_00090 [bacterium]
MRTSVFVLVLFVMVMGCGREEEPEPTREERQAREEQRAKEAREGTGYFGSLRRGLQKAKDQRLAGARRAIDAFQALKGRYPNDLAELKSAGFTLPEPPDDHAYEYDPATGEIELVVTE